MTEKPAKPAASKPTSSRKPSTRPQAKTADAADGRRAFGITPACSSSPSARWKRSSVRTSLTRNRQSAPLLSQPQARKRPLS